MTVHFKVIKPSRLKIAEFRLEFLNAMRKVGTSVKADYLLTVEGFKDPPKFEVLVSLTGPGPVMSVETNSELYAMLEKGTKPHIIVPVRAKVLRFQTGYKPLTTPGFIGTNPGGGIATGDIVYTQYVEHPGMEPRKFTETIVKKWDAPFKREMEEAMRRAIKKSGHAMK